MKTVNESILRYSFFDGMRPEHLAVLSNGAKTAQFKAGEMIFREREPARQCCLIESGKIVLEAHDPADGTTAVQTLSAGDVLGWSWLFPPFVWHFQARAVEPTNVIVLNGANLLVSAERDHDFGYELMKRVAQVVIRRLPVSAALLSEEKVNIYGHHDESLESQGAVPCDNPGRAARDRKRHKN